MNINDYYHDKDAELASLIKRLRETASPTFGNKSSSMKDVRTILSKAGGFKYNMGDVAVGSTNRSFKLPLKSGLQDSSIIQAGSSLFTYPAWVLHQGAKGYYASHTVDDLYRRMGAASGFSGMKKVARDFSKMSRSSVATSLGADWSLAFHRGFYVDINELKVGFDVEGRSVGTRTVREHLQHVQELLQNYYKSGGNSIYAKEKEIGEYYKGLVGAVEGSSLNIGGRPTNLHVSTVKDMLFRSGGYASMLAPQSIAFGVGMKEISKGIHQYAKITPINLNYLRRSGIRTSTPAASGTIATNEANFFNAMGEWSGIKGNYVGRLSMNVGYVVGSGDRIAGMKPSMMADSYWLGSDRAFRILSSIDRQGMGRTSRVINTTGMQPGMPLAIHNKLRPVVEQLMSGAIKPNSASGFYQFDKPLLLGRSLVQGYQASEVQGPFGTTENYTLRGIKGSNKSFGGIYLGTNVKGFVPTEDSEVIRAAVSEQTHASHLKVYGLRLTNEGVQVEYSPYNKPKYRGRQGAIEAPVLLGGTRGTLRATRQNLGGLDIIARGADVGLDISGDRLTASPEFLTKRIIPHLAHKARQAGKLREFAKFAGLGYGTGEGIVDPHVFFRRNTEPTGPWLNEFLGKITGSSEAELQSLGIAYSARRLIGKDKSGYFIPKRALSRIQTPLGPKIGIKLQGQEFIRRSGLVEQARIGKGAFSIRLQETMPLLKMQFQGMDPRSSVGMAYAGLYKHFMTGIKRGSKLSVYGARGVNTAGQMAGMLLAPSLQERATGGLFAGTKRAGATLTLEQWYSRAKAGKMRPMASNLAEANRMMRNPLRAGQLRGTIHSSGFKGMTLALPEAIESALTMGDNAKIIKQKGIYIPSDALLGSGITQEGVFFGRKGGLKELGLARQKSEMMTLLFQEMSTHEAAGGKLGEYRPSRELATRMAQFSSLGRLSMVEKYGMLYKHASYQPSGAMRGAVSDIASLGITEQGVVGLHVDDFSKLLESAGYERKSVVDIIEKRKAIYSINTRHPLHSEQNLQFSKVIPLGGDVAQQGRIYTASGPLTLGFGDYDHDFIQLIIEKSQQDRIAKIHAHRSRLSDMYYRAMDQAELSRLKGARASLLAQDIGGIAVGDILKTSGKAREALLKSISGRYRGAAGGGASVGAIDMFYRRMTSLGNVLSGNSSLSSEFISELSRTDADLGTRARLFANDANFFRYLGRLQEVGVYGILKKGATGFGAEELPVVQALAEYGKAPTEQTAARLRSALSEGIQKQFGEKNFKIGPEMDFLGLSSDELASGTLQDKTLNKILDVLMGDTVGHGGIGTLARARHILKQAGAVDPIEELFRGKDFGFLEGRNRKIASLSPNLIGENLEDMPVEALQGYAQEGTVINALNRKALGQTAAANQATKAQAAKQGFGVKAVTEFVKDTVDIINTPWGKRVAIGAGILGALGAIDSIFGSSPEEDIPAPEFVGSSGSPLPPPSIAHNYPDSEYNPPHGNVMRNRHANLGRIERPAASRQRYDVSAISDSPTDFGTSMAGYMGGAHRRPSYSSFNVNGRDRYSNKRTSYQTRRDIQSSF